MKPTQEQVIGWAWEAGFEVYDGDRFMPTHISDTLTHLHNPAVNLATLAYEAGRKDEREWQTLTDEEVLDAWLTHRDTSEATDGFVRAIEAKLKEKNGF
jgi:hypothetical protein